MPQTLVAINAHPDDEALLSGGTLALAAQAGHRVVLVTLTDGDAGPAAQEFRAGGLGQQRLRELQASAKALGAARVEFAGYSDSGMGPETEPAPPGRERLVQADLPQIVDQVCALLADETPNLILGYDAAGGYGHRDHVVVHHVARAVAERLSTRLLEATAPREPLHRALRALGVVRRFDNGFDPDEWADKFTPSADITHRIKLSRATAIRAKRAALQAHASQASADAGAPDRTMATLLRLPRPAFSALLGREYFHEPAGAPVAKPLKDIWMVA
ncbi:PIG-L deacetylase family protein [Ornithinimicrobium sp. INDO-MA30-4]|uniref:PIG-L deacetylase family protein n=1 Tax=Ornithinimicrobium sp. INDO-MA30-4 TaxID=2908651 RepID=UPI001F4477CD|nr:PIG-L family deacetylase [Ornithinimicrobium sp. INDO-MA30-4]UJH71493.1 PIG-L family deacetylase [Ornithinimicrobium sp. INDO-MA30-4]